MVHMKSEYTRLLEKCTLPDTTIVVMGDTGAGN